MRNVLEDCLEFLLKTVGGVLVLCLVAVLVFFAVFWPRAGTEPAPWLGIVGRDVDSQAAQQYRLPFSNGVFVERVIASSPADRSNLAPGDFIVKFNNRIVFGQDELRSLVLDLDPEEEVWMTVYRDGTYYNVMLRLGAKPTDQSLPAQAVAFAPLAGGSQMLFSGAGPAAAGQPMGRTPPPITADAILPHAYQGVCSNCHIIVSRAQASQPNNQLVTALRQLQNAQAPGALPGQPAPAWTGGQQLPGQNLPGAQPLTPLEEFSWAGIGVETFNPTNAAGVGVAPNATGVLVDDVLRASRGERGGVLAGDLIREINGFQVFDVDSFANVVQAQGLTGGVLLVNRNGRSMYVTVPER